MPDALIAYLSELDEQHVDVTQQRDIMRRLGELRQEFDDSQQLELARLAQIEQEVLGASKSLENGVGYQMSGVQTDADGNEHEFGWPDTSHYGVHEYAYLTDRWQSAHNLYLKSEYGLFLYLRKQIGRPEQVAELVNVFLELSRRYFAQVFTNNKAKPHTIYGVQALTLALRIGARRQRDPMVAAVLPAVTTYLLEVQQRWDAASPATPMLLGTFTSLVAEHPNLFQHDDDKLIAFLDKNRHDIDLLGQTYRYGAMELAQATSQLVKQVKGDVYPWELLVAQQYELLSHEAESTGNNAAMAFTEQALRRYQKLNDATAVARLRQQYQEWRTQFPLGEVRTPIPQEEQQALLNNIDRTVADSTEEQLLTIFTLTPMFPTLAAVQEHEKSVEKSFFDALPVTIQDKHGNPVEQFVSEDEKQRYRVLNTYGILSQLATHTLVRLMLEAHKAHKLSVDGVLSHLSGTWIGRPREVQLHGRSAQTQPLRLLNSGIRVLFIELDRWREDNIEPDFIAAIDSLVLKAEYLLRYLCETLGIATFKPKSGGVVHEKLLDELLRDLREDGRIDLEDIFFIRFFLQEKAGQNLRNRIAHGLMDDYEYGLENAFMALVVILKLANYQFGLPNHD